MTTGSTVRRLTPAQYRSIKLSILMDKCSTHDETEPCNEVCEAIDQAIDRLWGHSQMAAKKGRPT